MNQQLDRWLAHAEGEETVGVITEVVVGQRVRFMHNTRTPDDLDDILLLAFEKQRAREEEK